MLTRGEKLQDSPGVVINIRSHNSSANTSLYSDSSQYAKFSQTFIQVGPDILIKMLEDYIFIFYFDRVLFTFILSRKKVFQF